MQTVNTYYTGHSQKGPPGHYDEARVVIGQELQHRKYTILLQYFHVLLVEKAKNAIFIAFLASSFDSNVSPMRVLCIYNSSLAKSVGSWSNLRGENEPPPWCHLQ